MLQIVRSSAVSNLCNNEFQVQKNTEICFQFLAYFRLGSFFSFLSSKQEKKNSEQYKLDQSIFNIQKCLSVIFVLTIRFAVREENKLLRLTLIQSKYTEQYLQNYGIVYMGVSSLTTTYVLETLSDEA